MIKNSLGKIVEITNKAEALKILNENPLKLENASNELRCDYDVVLVAVNKYGYTLRFASKKFQSNKELVLNSINSGYSLKHASKKLQNDYDVVLFAVSKNPWFLEFASNELKNNQTILELYLNNALRNPMNSKFYDECKFKYNLLKEQEYLNNNIPISQISVQLKPKKF